VDTLLQVVEEELVQVTEMGEALLQVVVKVELQVLQLLAVGMSTQVVAQEEGATLEDLDQPLVVPAVVV
tara:strand:- start:12 stop:218 length:207 start_codon:yes stop_codon:yes gene_type:complete